MATAPTPITAAKGTRRKSRATQAAAKNTPPPAPTPAETPKGKDEIPAATVDLGATPVTYWFPKVTLSDGEVVACSHSKYGHESESAAKTCARSIVGKHAHRIAS